MQTSALKAKAVQSASSAILAKLTDQQKIARSDLNSAMTSAYGTDDRSGIWSQRDSFEMLEVAMTRYLAANDIAFDDLTKCASRLPTQTVRSEQQINLQQFSTPADIAFIAAKLANISDTDTVLEPSAGTGLLAAFAHLVGAKLHLNEIDENRANLLSLIFPAATVDRHNAAKIDNALGSKILPSVILMNPPFSKDVGRGDDHHAAVRHLRSALRLLRLGGRLVAIMPDWFQPAGTMKNIYTDTLTNHNVVLSARLEPGAYKKHGTQIGVRIYVIDKSPGDIFPTVIARPDAAGLWAAIKAVPPRKSLQDPVLAPTAVARKSSLFSSARAFVSPALKTARGPVANEIKTIEFKTLSDPAPLAEQIGIYLPYRPSRILFKNAGEHPTDLVESVAMGSIPMPIPDYRPKLPQRIVEQRLLSAAQLETVIYANHQWQQDLPGTYKLADKNIELIPQADGIAHRKGFFLGDGTGAGKGRQIAASIMEQWVRGNRRAIWVSKNELLVEDAKRDWADIGGMQTEISPLSTWKIGQPISMAEGILFVTYPTLRSQRESASRLEQILSWAGPEFDGVIAFDEAHEMGGVAGGEGSRGKIAGSQQGIAGVMLQHRLPHARVLYASATGASDVNNLAYAVRLGLWGQGTAFENRSSFIEEIRSGGIAAMELVARDLKATGMYIARSLSFAGVEYQILKHELTADQIAIYDSYSYAWSIIHQNMEEALKFTGVVDDIDEVTLNSGAKSAARSRFESTKQRFFGQLLLSMKLPTVITDIEKQIAASRSCVVQLVTTAESILNRRLGRLTAEEATDMSIDLSPREYVIDYLERAFPTRQMQEYTDSEGNTRSSPMSDDAGRPIYNEQAERARADLIEHLCSLPPIPSALDAVIDYFGPDRVAEITGRSRRLLNLPDGTQKLERRSARTNSAETDAFMTGKKRILVFSDAGGTGRSYHASLEASNQQRRVHYLAEPGWRADRAIQGLGRTHRTHQHNTPLFVPVTTDCKGELRFTSTIARRLDSLGALTRGQRQTGGQNLFDPSDNLESEYAKSALTDWFHLLLSGKLKSTTLADFTRMTGLELTGKDGVAKDDMPPIQRWLNRILALPIGVQNTIFDEFLGLIEHRVSAARSAGQLDLGVETKAVEDFEILDSITLRTDKRTGATSQLHRMKISVRKRPIPSDRIVEYAKNCAGRFYINTKSVKAAFAEQTRSLMDPDGTKISAFRLQRPLRREYLYNFEIAESNWKVASKAEFIRYWDEEFNALNNQIDESEIYIATGLLLPIWNKFDKEVVRIERICAADGRSLLGRSVDNEAVPNFLRSLGIESDIKLDIKQVIGLIANGKTAELTGLHHYAIRKRLVNGKKRTEIVKYPPAKLGYLKSLGCFTEIIAYKTRCFIPESDTEEIIEAIMREN